LGNTARSATQNHVVEQLYEDLGEQRKSDHYEGRERETRAFSMGDGIQTSRLGERFSSHTQTYAPPRRGGRSRDTQAIRRRLIAAAVELAADGSVPRLGSSRALP
jgi:hypothetical protein